MKTPIQFLCAKCKKAMTEYYKLIKRKQRRLRIKEGRSQEIIKVKINKK